MKDQHMRASSPFYSKPPGAPDDKQKENETSREDVLMRLAKSLSDKLEEECKKDPTITPLESVVATYIFLAAHSVHNRNREIDQGSFIASAIGRLVSAITKSWNALAKIEAREGVAG